VSAWTKGVVIGAAAALVASALLTGGTRAEMYVRVTGAGQYLLDARVDEPAVGRVVNVPLASLGEAIILKRSWIVATTYAFALRVRPELASGPERAAISGLVVTGRLPGRVVATNATRVAAGTAVWEGLPRVLQLRTVTVHWVRVVILAAVLALAIGVQRR